MTHIECLQAGTIYRNPIPHIKSVHAYFPSVVDLGGGEMLATFNLGQAFEAADLHVYAARSVDGGETWALEGRLDPGANGRETTATCRMAAAPNGQVVAYLNRHDRSRPDTGLGNPDNLGFVEVELMIMRSDDGGRRWTEAVVFEPPLTGPSFEMCSPVTMLRNGRWLLPTSTWRGWNGDCPNGMKMVAFVSDDQGRSWPDYIDVMADPDQEIIYWESKVIELRDGRLLGTAWAYNEHMNRDLPNAYAVSNDGGRSFTAPQSTGLQGQTLTPVELEDGNVLSVYRRMDRPGLWANVSRLEGTEWINEAEAPLWGEHAGGLTAVGDNMVENFNGLRFGAPSVLRLPDGVIYVAFWAVEDGVSAIRWMKLQVVKEMPH